MITMVIAALADDSDKSFMLDLYQDYYGLVRKTIYNIIHETENLEDLINDTFLKLIEKISLIKTLDCCKTAAYVVYTSRSVTINFLKHRNVQNKHVFYGEDNDLAEKISGWEETIADKIIHQEKLKEMGSAILRLPEKGKDLLYFKYILEMSNEELSEIMGIAPASVRQYLTRARRKAKSLMDKEVN